MEQQRAKEWFGTFEGISKTAGVVFAVAAAILGSRELEGFFGSWNLPRWWLYLSITSVLVVVFLALWRSYRSYVGASRLEIPEGFALRPAEPGRLVGRKDDLDALLSQVKTHRIVMLDGESGCGKTALVTAGLVPLLQQSDGLIPVPIQDWGRDWRRGPICAALDSLYHAVSKSDRERLGWLSAPDLAADTDTLLEALGAALQNVVGEMGRRPLLIADQFDDYQAQNRGRFMDNEGNWLSPAAFAASNRFWSFVRNALNAGHIHLLVVTRSDTAAGLVCVRFLGEEQCGNRTLRRVPEDCLRPLLNAIAPEGAQQPIVSNPNSGWKDLIELLEQELKGQGAVLMQQVHTVLLGLRQLPLLTPKHYLAVGGMTGVEALHLSRAIHNAAEKVGGKADALRVVRAVLAELVLTGSEDQAPKTKRAELVKFNLITNDQVVTNTILESLQSDEIVRPVTTFSEITAWQLDHDYLVRGVLADARQADHWAITLHEAKSHYDKVSHNIWKRWPALLSTWTLARIVWERWQGRLTFGNSRDYVLKSTIRPGVTVLGVFVAISAGALYEGNQRLTLHADSLVSPLGEPGANDRAVRSIWSAPDNLRRRVYQLATKDPSTRARALASGWPLADAGFENTRILGSMQRLREAIGSANNSARSAVFLQEYISLTHRQTSQVALFIEAKELRTQLEWVKDSDPIKGLVGAYAVVAAKLTDQQELLAEARAWRTQLEWVKDNDRIEIFATAYAVVAKKLIDQRELLAEAREMRAQIEKSGDNNKSGSLATAYAEVTTKLTDQRDLLAEAKEMRAQLEREGDNTKLRSLARAYAEVAAKLTDQRELVDAAKTLGKRFEKANPFFDSGVPASVYAMVAAQLTDQQELVGATKVLRKNLMTATRTFSDDRGALAYAKVAAKLIDQGVLREEARELRIQLRKIPRTFTTSGTTTVSGRLQLPDEPHITVDRLAEDARASKANGVAMAYGLVAAKLTNQTELLEESRASWTQLEEEKGYLVDGSLVWAYAAVTANLTDQTELLIATKALRKLLEESGSRDAPPGMARAYALVAANLTDQGELLIATKVLRKRLEQAVFSTDANELAGAYARVAANLADQGKLLEEVRELRMRLQKFVGRIDAQATARAYVGVVVNLTDQGKLLEEAAQLRSQLEVAGGRTNADSLAKAYAAVAATQFRTMDKTGRMAETLVAEVLTSAGHPFVFELRPLLGALKSVAGIDFEDDVGRAVLWAKETYGIRPEQLRPQKI